MRRLAIPALVVVSMFFGACGPKMIPGLDIEVADNPDNRVLLGLVEKFQQAYENKDVDALLAMASPKFYETSGTSKTDDDYNLDGLRTHFSDHFKMLKKVSLNISLKGIKVDGDEATIDYHFLARYQMKLPTGERWQIKDDVNRMKLAKEDGQWKVLSGM
ncbi:MAG TPA: nuclear transport factor 2 family protein [Myxococcota bacterium]|nr:nuclear transport factor 2 family protein [Myxococcota bacterium]